MSLGRRPSIITDILFTPHFLSFSRPGTRAVWWVLGLSGPLYHLWSVAAALAAGMLRKSSSSSGGGETKHTQGLPQHLSKPHTRSVSAGSTNTLDMGRSSRNCNPLSSIGLTSSVTGAPGVDPEYVMQLVNDVRWFADVLLNLKDAFQNKGEFRRSWNSKILWRDWWVREV